MFNLIQTHGLFIIPLCSIDRDNVCTCGNEKCTSPGKHPHLKYNWKITASNDINQIKNWSHKYKNLNWGVLTGRKASSNNKYLVVIDVDDKNHRFVKRLPKTFSYSTGNGYHYWFWSNEKIPNSVSKLDEKVDVRCSNGYVVVPPSKHSSGREYKLLNNSFDILDLPDFIHEIISDTTSKIEIKNFSKINNKISKNKTNTELYSVSRLRKMICDNKKIPIGSRNTSIHKLLSSDRAKGNGKDDLYTKALNYIEHVEDSENFNFGEISKIIDSVLKYPPYFTLNHCSKQVSDVVSLSSINKTDVDFFKKIKPTSVITCTITQIMSFRSIWYFNNNIPESKIQQFQPQEISLLLKEMGIKRARTKNGNVWYCYVENN
jgi:hypothetical protein